MEDKDKTKKRINYSLLQLTREIIKILESSSDGILNLNEVASSLQVQKRRLYDISHVLEGVGLMHKLSKNKIQWNGSTKKNKRCNMIQNQDFKFSVKKHHFK